MPQKPSVRALLTTQHRGHVNIINVISGLALRARLREGVAVKNTSYCTVSRSETRLSVRHLFCHARAFRRPTAERNSLERLISFFSFFLSSPYHVAVIPLSVLDALQRLHRHPRQPSKVRTVAPRTSTIITTRTFHPQISCIPFFFSYAGIISHTQASILYLYYK